MAQHDKTIGLWQSGLNHGSKPKTAMNLSGPGRTRTYDRRIMRSRFHRRNSLQIAILIGIVTIIVTSLSQNGHAATLHTVTSTSYCLTGTTASGATVRPGIAASNMHPLGTRIRLTRPAMGRRNWVIKDRIGHGSQLDLWASSCGVATAWGRRTVTYRVIGGRR